jgi:hypothetical protein
VPFLLGLNRTETGIPERLRRIRGNSAPDQGRHASPQPVYRIEGKNPLTLWALASTHRSSYVALRHRIRLDICCEWSGAVAMLRISRS